MSEVEIEVEVEVEIELESRWFPVCRGGDAVARHVVHTALLGQELAVWRADTGTVNAWENRCPHRGVRLSVGTNLGHVLKCRYHGWTFESGSGRCVERPAHPGQKPPALARARVFPCVEEYGYVWVRLLWAGEDAGEDADEDTQGPAVGSTQPALTLRSMYVQAPAAMVAEFLARHAREAPDVSAFDSVDPYAIRSVDSRSGTIRYFLQPVAASETVIHAALADTPSPVDRLAVLRRENDRLRAVRDAIEAHASP